MLNDRYLPDGDTQPSHPGRSYRINTVLTDNGIQFTHKPGTSTNRIHSFDRICASSGIEHRLTKPNHLWTNGQVERMNYAIKDAAVRTELLPV